MTTRKLARPAAAGALCLAVTGAAAQAAPAQTTDTTAPTATAAEEPRIQVRQRDLNVVAGRRTEVLGRVAPGQPGLVVSLQLKRNGRWKPIDRDQTNALGRYTLRERVSRTGSTPLRVRVAPAAGVVRHGTRHLGRLNVFRRAYASWYGPGFYGNRTACGGVLGYGTLGVAHKTLPCGARVTLRHDGRTVRVRVIDRGPYVGGREYDLTGATARRLGFHGHGPILVTR